MRLGLCYTFVLLLQGWLYYFALVACLLLQSCLNGRIILVLFCRVLQDLRLLDLVDKNAMANLNQKARIEWDLIAATAFPGRDGKECKYRHKQLSLHAAVRNDPLSEQDDRLIRDAVAQWSETGTR